MFNSIADLPKEVTAKLTTIQQEQFLLAYNEAANSGKKTTGECFREGWIAAVKFNGRIVHQAFLFQPGDWDAASGDGKITDENVTDGVFAINRRVALGVPIGLKYDHSLDIRSIPVGIVGTAVEKENSQAFGDLYIYQDARADLDGKGSKILATIDQIADAILTDGMKLSVEAFRDVKIKSYYGDRVISLEPSAMAVLPSGVAPAVTDRIVAGRGKKSIVFLSANINPQKGSAKMTLEELIAIVADVVERLKAVETALGEKPEGEAPEGEEELPDEVMENSPIVRKLKKEIKEYAERLKALENEKLAAEIADLKEELVAKMLPEQVKKLDETLEGIANLSEQKVALARLNNVVEELPEDEQKLRAGRTKAKDSEDKFNKEVDERMDKTGESRFVASRAVLKTMNDSDIETEETSE